MNPENPVNRSVEDQIKAERKQDILLLLQHLVQNEQVTVRLILDCLYDIGATNIINRNIPAQPFKGMTKGAARLSKPLFRAYALRWFKQNCPELITNWLLAKVEFKQKLVKRRQKKINKIVNDMPIPTATPPQVSPDETLREVKLLQSQVRVLTGTLVLAIAALGATAVWLGGARLSTSPFIENVPASQFETVNSANTLCPEEP